MSSIPTPHIAVKDLGVIADVVIMPGDPIRAKLIAEKFLTKPVLFNEVRGMLGYTGSYKGRTISVMGSGMGTASMGIYSFELFAFYQVEKIIRVGSCGAYHPDYHIHDILLVKDAWSDSSYAQSQSGEISDVLAPSSALNSKIITTAAGLNIALKDGRVYTTEVFYRRNPSEYQMIRDTHHCIAVEMEAFALFANANQLGKEAACLLTVSDSLVTQVVTTSEERQNDFITMIHLALESCL